MEPSLLHSFAKIEKDHWWFYARRKIVERTLEQILDKTSEHEILELGCGTGGNLEMLSAYGKLSAVELDDIARQYSNQLGVCKVDYARLPDDIDIPQSSIDLAVLLDVIEHIDSDAEALAKVREILRPNGQIVITVPAMPSMWSAHDDANHHFRRYTRESLKNLAENQGFKIERCHYFNTTLFPLAYIERKLLWKLNRTYKEPSIPTAFVNTILKAIFSFEKNWICGVNPSFGLSLLLVARKAT